MNFSNKAESASASSNARVTSPANRPSASVIASSAGRCFREIASAFPAHAAANASVAAAAAPEPGDAASLANAVNTSRSVRSPKAGRSFMRPRLTSAREIPYDPAYFAPPADRPASLVAPVAEAMYADTVIDVSDTSYTGNDILHDVFHAALRYGALERCSTVVHLDTHIAGINVPL